MWDVYNVKKIFKYCLNTIKIILYNIIMNVKGLFEINVKDSNYVFLYFALVIMEYVLGWP